MKTAVAIIVFFVCYACKPFQPNNEQLQSETQQRTASPDMPLGEIMDSLKLDKTQTRIYIDKSERVLKLFANNQLLKTYPVVLGGNPVDDKLQQGDNCTPEGKFAIRDLYPHKSWDKFIWVNYPTEASYVKHNDAKKQGRINHNAEIGGEIGIHGVPEGKDEWIDNNEDWTAGCISLKNEHIREIFASVQTGTQIEIVQ